MRVKGILYIFIVFFLGGAVFACEQHEHNAHDHKHHELKPTQPSQGSLFEFHDKFTDQNGNSIMLHDLQGNNIVFSMFYTTCTSICPRIASEMLIFEKKLSAKQAKKIKFVLLSFDTETDDTAHLKKFEEKMKLTPSFVLLTGQPDSVREIAAALGINYKKLDDGEFAHSSVFTLLSPDGEIIHQHVGLNMKADEFIAKLQ